MTILNVNDGRPALVWADFKIKKTQPVSTDCFDRLHFGRNTIS